MVPVAMVLLNSCALPVERGNQGWFAAVTPVFDSEWGEHAEKNTNPTTRHRF